MKNSRDGWALVSVLWVLAMLSMLAAAIQALTVTSARSERHAEDGARAATDLDAAITRAALGIGDPRTEQRWRIDGTPTSFDYDGVKIKVTVQGEAGRFDLNAIDVSMLRQLLQSAGLDEGRAEIMADRILDWRSLSDLARLHGATDADYVAEGLRYHPRHGPYQSVAELQLVLGMTPELYKRIRPALTVYTGRPMIDPAIAPKESLQALYFNEPQKVEMLLDERHQAQENLDTPHGIAGPIEPLIGQPFAITAELRLGGKRFVRDAVIDLTGDDRRPYFILAWQ